MTIDQLEAIGEEVAHAIKTKHALDYIRFDAGTGQFDEPVPWAVLFVARRGYENRTSPEIPRSRVRLWMSMTDAQIRDALYDCFDKRAQGLVPEKAEQAAAPLRTMQTSN